MKIPPGRGFLFHLALPALVSAAALAAFPAGAHCSGQPCTPALRAGFGPLRLPGGGTSRGGHVVFADLGITPGRKSLVFGTSTGRLYVVRYDGTVAPGFPVTLPREIVSTPAVGTLTLANGSKTTAIVVGYGSNYSGQVDAGGLRAYATNGTLLWEAASRPFVGSTAPVVGAPAIGDLDADGKNEVVWTSFDHHIHVSDGTGAEKPGFPFNTFDTIWSSPALFDFDGDGKLEIIVGSDQHLEGPPISTPDGGGLWVVRHDGTRHAGFPQFVDQVITSSPAVGDIDGDGRAEIVVGTGGFWPGATHAVYAFRCDGSEPPGWPVAVQGQVRTAPALADLSGDGVPEVIVTDDDSGPDKLRRVYAIRGNGNWHFAPVVVRDYFGANLSAGDPLVADVLGDASPEILVPTNGEIFVVSRSGAPLTDGGAASPNNISFMGVTSMPLSSVAVGTLDASPSKIDIVSVSGISGSGDAGVWVWNPKAPTLPVPWGMFHFDALHHGVVPGTRPGSVCGSSSRLYTVAPCRLVDTRGASPGAIGGPALAGLESRAFVLTNRCSVPADARALVLNLTATAPAAPGSLTVFPGNTSMSNATSIVSFAVGQTRAAATTGALSMDGSGILNVANLSAASVHVILDVTGYFR